MAREGQKIKACRGRVKEGQDTWSPDWSTLEPGIFVACDFCQISKHEMNSIILFSVITLYI